MALFLEVVAQDLGVDQVAVVTHGERAVSAFDANGLGVLFAAGACRRVAGVADGDMAGKIAEVVLFEDLGDEAHAAVHVDPEAVGGGDAGALLAAVLEGVDAVEGDAGYVFIRRVDAEYAALLSPGLPDGPYACCCLLCTDSSPRAVGMIGVNRVMR